MHITDTQLHDFIVDSGILSRAQAASYMKLVEEGKMLEDILVEEGRISEEDLLRIKAYIVGIPFINLSHEPLDFETLSLIPEPLSRAYGAIAFRISGSDLEVAFQDPKHLSAVNFLADKHKMRIAPRLTDKNSIKNALKTYQKGLDRTLGDRLRRENTEEVSEGDIRLASPTIDVLLSHAQSQHASSIHLEPTENGFSVRYRIQGRLHDAMVLQKAVGAKIIHDIKSLARLDTDDVVPQYGSFVMNVVEGTEQFHQTSFRVSTIPTIHGEKMTLRIVPSHSAGFSLEYLGFHGQGIEYIHDALQKTFGVILVTGSPKSGKTTLLYTLADMIDSTGVSVGTIEEKIEYKLPHAHQTMVREDKGMDVAAGLRALRRSDVDVIVAGNLPTMEASSIALSIAASKLVLAGIEAESAISALMKIKNIGDMSSVHVVIGTKLVQKLSLQSEKYLLTKAEITTLSKKADLPGLLKVLKEEKVVSGNATWETIPFYRQNKAKRGENDEGRTGVHEILIVSDQIRHAIIEGATEKEIRTQAHKEGMLTYIEDGIYKAVKGEVSLEELFK